MNTVLSLVLSQSELFPFTALPKAPAELLPMTTGMTYHSPRYQPAG